MDATGRARQFHLYLFCLMPMTIIFFFATASVRMQARFHRNISAIISQRKMTHGCKQRRHLRFGEAYATRTATRPIWNGNK